jgi:hypothetical protein
MEISSSSEDAANGDRAMWIEIAKAVLGSSKEEGNESTTAVDSVNAHADQPTPASTAALERLRALEE